jgi:hypothetical protein
MTPLRRIPPRGLVPGIAIALSSAGIYGDGDALPFAPKP